VCTTIRVRPCHVPISSGYSLLGYTAVLNLDTTAVVGTGYGRTTHRAIDGTAVLNLDLHVPLAAWALRALESRLLPKNLRCVCV
jgi:hypothetical protein